MAPSGCAHDATTTALMSAGASGWACGRNADVRGSLCASSAVPSDACCAEPALLAAPRCRFCVDGCCASGDCARRLPAGSDVAAGRT
eukprot:365139-Chlamydomonas_euryale.AAC.31